MFTDAFLAKAIFIKTALEKNPSYTLDSPTAVYLCEKIISYDEALRSAMDLVRRFPCDHIGKIYGKDSCLRCQTLESVSASFESGNGKKAFTPRKEPRP